MGAGATRFQPVELLDELHSLPGGGRLIVAYSGGLDSTALLLSLADLRPELGRPVAAVHVNHGQHARSDRWQDHCRESCETLGVPLSEFRIEWPPLAEPAGEAELRRRRYDCFAQLLEPGDVLLTAHHQEDQAETVLLNLLRGSGPEGLRGMPARRPLGRGQLARPLMAWSRAALEQWLRGRGEVWLEDPDNANRSRDRNYLRHEVLPVLRRRWSHADAALCRSAVHAAEAAALAEHLLDAPLAAAVSGSVLALDRLGSDEPALLRAALRLWVRREGAPPIPSARLQEFCRQLLEETTGGAVLAWEGHSLRSHDRTVWLDSEPAAPGPVDIPWDGSAPLELGGGLGTLAVEPPGEAPLPGRCRVVLRGSGERFRTSSDRPSRALKDLLREARVPPWLRGSVPLLRAGDQLLAVGDWLLEDSFRARLQSRGATLRWRPAHPALRAVRKACHGPPEAC